MIQQGVWVLMIMLYTGPHEITLVPYLVFPNSQLCEAWKGRESLDLRLPLTCVRDGGEV